MSYETVLCQNDYPFRVEFWQKISFITHIYFLSYAYFDRQMRARRYFFREQISFPGKFCWISKKLSPPSTYSNFKTDIIRVVLVFSISNFFVNKNSQGRKSVREKSIPSFANSTLAQAFLKSCLRKLM